MFFAFFLIIILILIIICEILNRKFNETWNVKYYFNKPKYENYIIDLIGITRSIATFWPNPTSNLISHTDIILYCHNPKTFKFKFILLYSTNYKHLPIYETINNKNIKYNMITNLKAVNPNHKYHFKLNNYTYRITNFYHPNNNWTVGEIYDIYKNVLHFPYHRLYFNCHHVVNFILDITTNKKRKYFFEFDNSEKFKPILYLYTYLKEKCGFNVMNKLNFKKLNQIVKNKKYEYLKK